MTGRDLWPWAGISGAVIGWSLSHQVGSNAIFDDCRDGGTLVVLVSAAGLVVTILGALLSLGVARRGEGARRFVALVGLMLAALAGFAILLQAAAGLILPACAT